MSIRTWLSKRGSKRRDRKYAPLREAFDAVVAVDSGVDHLLTYHGVGTADVQSLVRRIRELRE